jgi:hypothetical protein
MLPNSTERAVTISGSADSIILCMHTLCQILLEVSVSAVSDTDTDSQSAGATQGRHNPLPTKADHQSVTCREQCGSSSGCSCATTGCNHVDCARQSVRSRGGALHSHSNGCTIRFIVVPIQPTTIPAAAVHARPATVRYA